MLAGEYQRGEITTISKLITAIGKAALVKVGTRTVVGDDGKPASVPKWASAHDLRRTFGERWSGRLLPQALMELMRHESMSTTLKFYVGQNAERTADAVWAAFEAAQTPEGNKKGNTQQIDAGASA